MGLSDTTNGSNGLVIDRVIIDPFNINLVSSSINNSNILATNTTIGSMVSKALVLARLAFVLGDTILGAVDIDLAINGSVYGYLLSLGLLGRSRNRLFCYRRRGITAALE